MTLSNAAVGEGSAGRSRPRSLVCHRAVAYLLAPGILLLFIFVYPVSGLLSLSLQGENADLRQYAQVFAEPLYLEVLLRTFVMAGAVTALCVVLGYPVAYVLVGLSPRMRAIALAMIMVPFFISIIVRTYAWMVLLGRTGLINATLGAMGLITEPLPIMYSRTGALIGMCYALLPYMILTSFNAMRTLDGGLIRAAHSLGAGRLRAFLTVFLPVTSAGVLGGVVLVFIMSLGFFITPRLMGGPSDLMIAMLIEHEVEMTLNWPFAAALATVLLVVTVIGFALYSRLVRFDRMLEAHQ